MEIRAMMRMDGIIGAFFQESAPSIAKTPNIPPYVLITTHLLLVYCLCCAEDFHED